MEPKVLQDSTLGKKTPFTEDFLKTMNLFYLRKKENFKVAEMVDVICEQPNIPYLIIRKLLKWFIYDNPKEELVHYYGDYIKKKNFEIEPPFNQNFHGRV